ncbi:MAG: NUDIX hydrolase [Myxococcales bacterium]|nr:NUDIX hydrolase [Myxococcales bacterium]
MTKRGFEQRVPDGDSMERAVCGDCGFIDYQNPRIICGVVPVFEEKLLLCTRAIAPRIGYWTVPAGFMELGESPAEGAAREAMEEANAEIEIGDLIGVYSVRHVGQVHMYYRGILRRPEFSAGPESKDVRLFAWDEIPWEELAFPTIKWALRDFERNLDLPTAVPGSRSTPNRPPDVLAEEPARTK